MRSLKYTEIRQYMLTERINGISGKILKTSTSFALTRTLDIAHFGYLMTYLILALLDITMISADPRLSVSHVKIHWPSFLQAICLKSLN